MTVMHTVTFTPVFRLQTTRIMPQYIAANVKEGARDDIGIIDQLA